MVRYVEGLPGAAVGAADHAVIERNPIGAAPRRFGRGRGSASNSFATLHFDRSQEEFWSIQLDQA